jgi:hypothetical protein
MGVCRTGTYGVLNLGIVVNRVVWRKVRIAPPVIQDQLAAAFDDVASASTQRQCIEDSLQLRRINRHQGTLPCEMVSARAELRQFSKESLVCVTSMVSFQVFVRLPKLCQREMSRVYQQ